MVLYQKVRVNSGNITGRQDHSAQVRDRSGLGFTIVEVLVYLFLLGIFSFVLIRLDRDVRLFANFSTNEVDRLIREQLVFDIMFRDIVSGSCDIVDWCEEKFIFRKKTLGRKDHSTDEFIRSISDVGFEFRDGKIFRYEGSYDFIKNIWLKKVSSVIFQHARVPPTGRGNRLVLRCQLSCENGAVRLVKIFFGDYTWSVRLRSGYVF